VFGFAKCGITCDDFDGAYKRYRTSFGFIAHFFAWLLIPHLVDEVKHIMRAKVCESFFGNAVSKMSKIYLDTLLLLLTINPLYLLLILYIAHLFRHAVCGNSGEGKGGIVLALHSRQRKDS
jgi:hypothetical protein